MVHPNNDEIMWANRVRASYDRQVAEGVDRPTLSEFREKSAYGLGGVRLEYLGQLGLQLKKDESTGGSTFIVPLEEDMEVTNG